MEKKGESTEMGYKYSDYYKDPFIHSELSKRK